MKQPVWFLNSSLLILFFMSHLLLFILQKAVPRRISISVGKIEVEAKQDVFPVDIVKIYEHDIFGTYQPPIVPIEPTVDLTVPPIPIPPKFIIPDVPVEKAPTFFAPLDVVLKGVIFVKDDPASCIAIVQLKKTKEEHNYQVGDLIEDAQILKILSNRIIIIRSNGQQETLYLREEDAISDFNTEVKSDPKLIVEDSSDNKYIINIDEFVKKIHNLGEFINLLDLTTVYKQGKSFGFRIGKIDKDSLASLLGFKREDIIVKIDNYHVDDLANRMQVYDHILQKKAGEIVEVILLRNDERCILRYALIDKALKSLELTPTQIQNRLMEELSRQEAESMKIMSEKIIIIDDEVDENINQQKNLDSIDKLDEQSQTSQSNVESEDVLNFSDLEENVSLDSHKRSMSPNKTISAQVGSKSDFSGVKSSDQLALQGPQEHRKKMMEEKNKLSSTVSNLRSKDKNNMMRRTSKNVISQGI